MNSGENTFQALWQRCGNRNGFSLIELLIAMAVVAIIASIALPSWKAHLLASRRTEAIAMLTQLSNRQEQFRLQYQRYATTDQLTTMPPTGLGILNDGKRYVLTATTSAHEFTAFATAAPAGTQADDLECWQFGLDQNGRRWSESRSGKITTARCWRS